MVQFFFGLALALSLAACMQPAPSADELGLAQATATASPPIPLLLLVSPSPTAEGLFTPTPMPSPTPEARPVQGWQPLALTSGLRDVLPLLSGICFEAAYDAAGRVFVLRSPADLETFYNLADNSRLCRRPVRRYAFDFANDTALIGTWTRGLGCTARHELTEAMRDDEARVVRLRFRFIQEGDCAYELVRPLWIAVAQATGYDLSLVVE
ncbi:MAG: hypothetical protein NZ750_12560 [Anaerolineae bacterium]|nr:hypothetical protein [Anaerolineae bacterium]MDW8173609.1 hypothetical protein [Anaerolineae bacterium]